MQEGGNWSRKDTLTKEIKKRIDTLGIEKAKEDVRVSTKDFSVLTLWSRDYFKLLTERMTF